MNIDKLDSSAILLENPKYIANLGMIKRLASCYDIKYLFYTGTRIDLTKEDRIPRELRMKEYNDVELIHLSKPFDFFQKTNLIPIAVELRDNSQSLQDFNHPEKAVYIFGPEDGSVSQGFCSFSHQFVKIPTKHCLNLATAISAVMWDKQLKA